MTKKSILLLAFIATALFIISCGKKAEEDTEDPVITITGPTGTLMQMGGGPDSSTVSAHITDEDLHAYSILITRTDGSDTLLYVPETHQEVNDLFISKKFPLHLVVGTVAYKITVKAEDHSGNEGEATGNFSVEHM